MLRKEVLAKEDILAGWETVHLCGRAQACGGKAVLAVEKQQADALLSGDAAALQKQRQATNIAG